MPAGGIFVAVSTGFAETFLGLSQENSGESLSEHCSAVL